MFTLTSKEECHLNSVFVVLTNAYKAALGLPCSDRTISKMISATHRCVHGAASAGFGVEGIQNSF